MKFWVRNLCSIMSMNPSMSVGPSRGQTSVDWPFCPDLPELLWPHNASCGARAVNVQISVGSSQLFWDEAFVVLTDPVPSTNYHNGNNNMQSIVWLREQKTHTLFIWLHIRLLIPLYLSIQAIPTGFLWESYQTPSRSDGYLIVLVKLTHVIVPVPVT